MYILLKMKNLFIYFALFFSSIIVAQFGQGMQQGGMQGRGNQMNQMNQISQPRMEEKKPEPLTSDQVLKKNDPYYWLRPVAAIANKRITFKFTKTS